MAERPTQSESWYRVAQLRPRLRSSVQTFRQYYRNKLWHVLTDPANNDYFRVDENAYYFLGLLDGERTVAQAWAISQQYLGDAAPTQGEAINLLGRLFVCNLLQAELSPDVRSMFERIKKRKRQKIGGQLMNLLFLRIPLYDPDHLLDRWVRIVGLIFSRGGFALWMLLLMVGGWHLLGKQAEMGRQTAAVLDPRNLVWLSVSFWGLKLLHEFGHAFACKRFGEQVGSGGEVHTMGMMLVALMPVPYVDASSSWAFRSKWHRAAVGAAGMYIELAVAAIAAIVWAKTGSGTLTHQLAYNIIFLASVSTVLFNGNPLLRYDAYYMLCDVLEIPNLAQRSKDYLYFKVKAGIFGAVQLQDPTHGDNERKWFIPFAVASTIYRLFVSVTIILFVASQLFIIGLILAVTGVVTMFILPTLKFIRYLGTGEDISRVRGRAVGTSLGVGLVAFITVGVIPVSDGGRAEGIIEPRNLVMVTMPADGFIENYLPSGQLVTAEGQTLIVASNEDLQRTREHYDAQLQISQALRRDARDRDPASVVRLTSSINVLDTILAQTDRDLQSLNVKAPISGTWIASDMERRIGAYMQRGEMVGVVATLDDLMIRVTADQHLGPRITPEIGEGGEVDIRVQGRPDIHFKGRIARILPAGQQRLPSKALSVFAGGSLQMDTNDRDGERTADAFFEVHIDPVVHDAPLHKLFTGQRVVVKFDMPARPLLVQGWRALRQVLQQRFQI